MTTAGMTTAGLHHITAIASDAQRNLSFYRDVLGLRMVKKTVNFDDPSTYHLYFGDRTGTPGTIMTFFPWPGAQRGRLGSGQVSAVAYAVPAGTLGWWAQHFIEKGVTYQTLEPRFGQTALSVTDPDGLTLELVDVVQDDMGDPWTEAGVPAMSAIRAFHGVTIWSDRAADTQRVLTEVFGYRLIAQTGETTRFSAGGPTGAIIDVRDTAGVPQGALGAGGVHHVALRAADDATQAAMAGTARSLFGIRSTPQVDRVYFRSVYFREPSGVLLEIATDDPGFTVDEPVDGLGSSLRLPPQHDIHRSAIEAGLPPIQ